MAHIMRRTIGVVAGAAALTLGTATVASAHHCYKVDWNDRAYENHMRGGTAWVSLSGLGSMIIAQDIGLPQCADYSYIAVDHWMEQTGTTTEPLIHSKATIASGAMAHGKSPKPINSLGEADFVILGEGLTMAVDACMAGA